jgi:hypothetical protein
MSSPPAAAKVCVQCGQDCSTKPRNKDSQGRYTCRDCYDKLLAAHNAKAAIAPAAPTIPLEEPSEDGALAAILTDPAPALTESCPSCGSALRKSAVICTICGYNKQTGKTIRTGFSKETPDPSEASSATAVVKAVASVPMVLGLSALGGAIAGAAGAILWAVIAYQANLEIGWIAWLIGIMVGAGTVLMARGHAGVMTGLIAAAIALLSIGAGKYAAVSMVVDATLKHDKSVAAAMHHQITDEEIIAVIAHGLAEDQATAGKTLQWPSGVDPDEAERPEQFPPGIWSDAEAVFGAMSPVEKDQVHSKMQELSDAAIREGMASLKEEAFKSTLGVHDVLWAILAICSAFAIGSGARSIGPGDVDT